METPIAQMVEKNIERRQRLSQLNYPQRDAPAIIAVASQKGGVGKTTTAVNIAASLAINGQKTLFIDIDPQANASTALGVEHFETTDSVYQVVTGKLPFEKVIQKCPDIENLDVAPASINLAGAEIELVSSVSRETRLKKALAKFLEKTAYDFVVIDCPPSLGILSLNALCAANFILIPVQSEYYALEGLSLLSNTIQMVKENLNSDLADPLFIVTMYDSRTTLSKDVDEEVRRHFANRVLATRIPRSVRISEAPSYNKTIISYDLNSSGSLAYQEAAFEFATKIELK